MRWDVCEWGKYLPRSWTLISKYSGDGDDDKVLKKYSSAKKNLTKKEGESYLLVGLLVMVVVWWKEGRIQMCVMW